MTQKLRLTSLKSLEWAIVDLKAEKVQDPFTKLWETKHLPRFDKIVPPVSKKKLTGQTNGQPFIITKYTYELTEEMAQDAVFYDTGESLTWTELLDLCFTCDFIKTQLLQQTIQVELLINDAKGKPDDSDKEAVAYLLSKGYIQDHNINNATPYVEDRQGITQKTARSFIEKAASASNVSESASGNDSVPTEVAKSPALAELKAEAEKEKLEKKPWAGDD